MPPSRATMLSAAGAASRLFAVSYGAPLNGLGFLTILVLSQVVLRRRWLAVGLTGILLVVLFISGENSAVEIPVSIALAALLLFAAVRFGVLAFTVALFVFGLLVVGSAHAGSVPLVCGTRALLRRADSRARGLGVPRLARRKVRLRGRAAGRGVGSPARTT